jgi:hypothetical protein
MICPRCGGTGLADAILVPEDLARSIVHKTVRCGRCRGAGVIGEGDAMNNPTQIDESLLKRRPVVTAVPDPDGPGWIVELMCGHKVWCAVRPMNFTYCGECLVELTKQARALLSEQQRPAGAHRG